MAKVVMFGAGQTAEIINYYFKNDSPYEVVACTIDGQYIKEDRFSGLPVIAFEDVTKDFPADRYDMFVAMGYDRLNTVRAEKYAEAKRKGYRLVNYVSSKAGIVCSVDMGDNCLILENQSIQPFVRIGSNVYIWGSSVIGHHSVVGDHCWLASEACIGGNSVIGRYCFIGLNATIGHLIKVGSGCLIGAGSLITRNVKDDSVFISEDTDVYPLDRPHFMEITKLK
jgi:sugar O-acyltransferase (sialic acid O-acetyltransferase NeuD family)